MKNLFRDLCRLLALACLLASGHWVQRRLWQQPAPAALPLELFLQHREDYELVDARTDAEFQSGHIPGAINLPVSQALRQRRDGQALLARGRSRRVLVYCDGENCNASAQVGRWLQEQGYQVQTLAGGYPGWLAAQGKRP
jgi:rhodanese-related sulfurtransferase